MQKECLYTTLQVSKSANETEIKKSYYKLAKAWHPDKHTDAKKKKEAEDKFKNITYAYEVLSDQKQRQIYDRMGFRGLQQNAGSSQRSHPFPHFSSFFGPGGDPFASFFGGGRSTPGPSNPKDKVKPRVHQYEVPLKYFYQGITLEFSLKQKEPCDHCNLINEYKTCTQCKGRGICARMMQVGPGMMVQTNGPCPTCKSTGELLNPQAKPCSQKDCQKGLQIKEVKHSFEITPGMEYGSHLIENKGDFLKAPNHRNDIVLEIRPLSSGSSQSSYQRQGSDLIKEETIALGESLLGFDYHIDHVDGERKIRLHSTKVIPPETVKCLPNQGLPIPNQSANQSPNQSKYGDLYIIFKVKFPESDSITPKTKKMLGQIMKRRQNTQPKDSPKIVPLNLDNATEKSPQQQQNKSSQSHSQSQRQHPNVECAQQ